MSLNEDFCPKSLSVQEKVVPLLTINPTTLLVRKASAPGWDFVFLEFQRMRYTKQAITLAEQIKTLHERGLFIEDDAEAIEVLEHISYFRLADYWRPLESDPVTHVFASGSRFSDVLRCYDFDKELKVLLFSAIRLDLLSSTLRTFLNFPRIVFIYGANCVNLPKSLCYVSIISYL